MTEIEALPRLFGRWEGVRPTERVAFLRDHALEIVLGLEVWCLFAGYLIWRTVAGPAWIWQDSRAYIAVAGASFPSVTLLAGARAPVVPLLWKVTDTPERYVVTQTIIAVLAWTALAVTVARLVRPGWRALLAGTVVLAFASSWEIVEWDWSVLSESISLSAVAVICASTIWLARRFTTPRAVVLLGACLVYAGARDQAIWIIALAGGAVCAFALLRLVARQHGPAPAVRVRGIVLLGVALLGVAVLNEAGAASAHRNVINVEDVFNVRVFPFPSRVAWFAAHGMPQAAAIDVTAAATPTPPGMAKVVRPDLASPTWRPLARWFPTDSEGIFIEYLVTHPGYDLTAPFATPALTYNNANGNLAFYGDINNGTRHFLPVIPTVLFPSWQIDLALAVVGISLMVVRRW